LSESDESEFLSPPPAIVGSYAVAPVAKGLFAWDEPVAY